MNYVILVIIPYKIYLDGEDSISEYLMLNMLQYYENINGYNKKLDENNNLLSTDYYEIEIGGRWDGYFNGNNFIKINEYLENSKDVFNSYYIDENCNLYDRLQKDEVKIMLERNKDNYLCVLDCRI